MTALRYPMLSFLLACGFIAFFFFMAGCATLERERARERAVTPIAAERQCNWIARQYDGFDHYSGLIFCDGAKPINNCTCAIFKN